MTDIEEPGLFDFEEKWRHKYQITNEGDAPGVTVDKIEAVLHGNDTDYWDVEILIGGYISMFLRGQPTEPARQWIVHDIDFWVDRRGPLQLEDLGICVAKLQARDEIQPALEALIWEE